MLEVLGKAAVSIEPSQCAFDDPTAWENHEAFCGIGPFDDFDGPFSDPAQRVFELVTGIAAIGEDVPQRNRCFQPTAVQGISSPTAFAG